MIDTIRKIKDKFRYLAIRIYIIKEHLKKIWTQLLIKAQPLENALKGVSNALSYEKKSNHRPICCSALPSTHN